MNYIGATADIVSLCFLIILLFMYFTKKDLKDDIIFSYTLITSFLTVVTDCLFLLSCWIFPGSLYIICLFKRFNNYFFMLFLIALSCNIISILSRNNKKLQLFFEKRQNLIFRILLFVIFLIGLFEFSMSYEYHYSGNYIDYVFSHINNILIMILFTILFVVNICFIFGNIVNTDKRKILLIYIVYLFQGVSVLLNIFEVTINFESLFVSLGSFFMFLSVENPDLKTISKLENERNSVQLESDAKNNFLKVLSVQLRKPAQEIVDYLESVKSSDDDSNGSIKPILGASHEILNIVNDLYTLTEIDNDNIKVNEIEYDTDTLFKYVENYLNDNLGTKPVKYGVKVSENMPSKLCGDFDKVKHILSHLLDNAICYTNSGYITVNFQCDYVFDKCNLLFSIIDSGVGISAEQIPRLFDKFYSFKEGEVNGIGLGLSITKGYIDLLDGKIDIQSGQDVGTAVNVLIPQFVVEDVNQMSSDKQKERIKRDYTKNKRYNILLIVDDNLMNVKVAEHVFTEFGYQVDSVFSGVDCLERINTNQEYDIIFMDIMMPDMDGVETLHKLRDLENFNIPVVALTADAMDGAREKYLNEGFDDYLSKPMNKKRVEIVLGKYT